MAIITLFPFFFQYFKELLVSYFYKNNFFAFLPLPRSTLSRFTPRFFLTLLLKGVQR